jgi:hypothetical protein
MPLGGILLGIINIAIVVAILILIGLVIVWFAGWMGFPVPANIQKVYMAIVALIALYLLVALLLGLPGVRVIGFHDGASVTGAAAAAISTGTAADLS